MTAQIARKNQQPGSPSQGGRKQRIGTSGEVGMVFCESDILQDNSHICTTLEPIDPRPSASYSELIGDRLSREYLKGSCACK